MRDLIIMLLILGLPGGGLLLKLVLIMLLFDDRHDRHWD